MHSQIRQVLASHKSSGIRITFLRDNYIINAMVINC